MTKDQKTNVEYRQELLMRLRYVLSVLEARTVEAKNAFSAIIEQECLAVVEAAWTTSPDFSKCAKPEFRVAEAELRVLTQAAAYIRHCEIPAAERYLKYALKGTLAEVVN